MKHVIRVFLAWAVSNCALCAESVSLTPKSSLCFASQEEAAAFLGAEDGFVRSLSPFDRAARMQVGGNPTTEEFCAFVVQHAREWTPDDMEKMKAAVAAIGPRIAEFDLPFPEKIKLFKSTGAEEGGAMAYTRGGALIVSERMLGDRGGLDYILAHELFHVLSRSNPDLRRALYECIGFMPCGEVEFPASLKDRKITNPDGSCDYYIRVTYKDETLPAVPILHASVEKYEARLGGPFFRFLEFRLMAIEQQNGAGTPIERDGAPLLLEPDQVSGFYEQIGRNTKYIIQPDEIIAENFALIIRSREDLPTPHIAQRIERALRNPKAPAAPSFP